MRRSSLFDRMFSPTIHRRGKNRGALARLGLPRSGLRRAELETLESRNLLAILTVNGAGGADYTTIGAAIAAAQDHDVIQVAAGVYNEQLAISASHTSLTIEGAGSGDSAADTIIDAGGGIGFNIQASGASAADRLTIEGLRVQNASNAIYVDAAVSHVTLDNVAAVNSSNGIEIHNSAVVQDLLLNNVLSTGNSNGFRVATTGSVDGLTIQGGAFDNNNIGFYTNATSSITTNQDHFTNVSISGASFSNNTLKGIYVEKLDHAVFDGIVVDNSGTSGASSAGVDINLKYGNYHDITIQNSSITGSGLGDATSGVGLTVKARSDAPSYNANPATLDGVLISHNVLSGNQTALRIGEAGGLASPTNVKINYNDLSSNVSGVALVNQASPAIDASKNWWGDISGPTAAANSGGLGQAIAGVGAANVTLGPWLIYGTDADPVAAGFQLPSTITVSAGGDISAADNDFTRLHNAIGAVADGQTVQLSGAFDWTSPFAAAAYAASNSDSSTSDIRGVLLPSGVNNVTITSSGGTAIVKGGGDFNDGIYSSFLFAADGPSAQGNSNLTIENLNLDQFEAGIMLGWNSTGQFNGTHVQNNSITVAGDNGGVQNIAVYFWHGVNQQMTGNTIDFEANGTNAGPSGPRSFGFQNGTTGGTGYDGLTISANTFQLLNAAAHAETLTGIWENGHNDNNNSHIAITNNQFLGVQGQQDFDRALMLTSQTSNMLVDGNTFTDVHYVFFARNASGGTSPGDQFTFTNNVLTRVGGNDGVFLRNVTDDATPTHVLIHWNINNTIDGETGVRGLNELSVEAAHVSRPTSGASDLDSVDAVGAKPVVFVDTDWNGAARFADPDGIGGGAGPVAYGFNGFSTIQQGIDNVDVGGTVNVGAGAYQENVDVNKSVSLLGPNAGIDPNTGARGAEAIVLPGANDTDNGSIFLVSASNVTIDGLTIDGNNPNLAGGLTLNGVNSNAANGVTNVSNLSTGDTFDVSGLTVRNNIIQNLSANGIYGDTSSGTPSIGNDFSHNQIDNIPQVTPRGRGILIADNFYAQITDNVITRVGTGIQTNNFYQAGSPALIDGNTIDYYVRGIFHNLQYQSASTFTISNNDITADAGAVANNGGLQIFSIQNDASVVIQNNNVTGAHFGVEIWNAPTANSLVVQGGTLAGNDYGVWATNNDVDYGAGDATTAVLDGVTISGSTIAGVLVDDQPAGANAIALAIQNSSISGGPVGVEISGARATASLFRNTISGATTGVEVDAGGNLGTISQATTENFITGNGTGISIAAGAGTIQPISGNDLSGNTTAALDNASGALVDASGNWWGDNTQSGVTGAMTGGNVDFSPWLNGGADLDAGTAGFQGDRSSLTVDGASPQAGSAAPIQEGVDLATAGGTVEVLAGAYAEEVSIDKDLTLAGLGNVTLSAPTPGSGTGVFITGDPNEVTLSGLSIEGFDTGLGTSGVATLNLSDVVLSGNALGGLIFSTGALNVSSSSTQDQTVSVTGGGQNVLQFAGQDAIDFSGVGYLSIQTGSGSDTFNVAPLAGTTIGIIGGDPAPPSTPGDTLLVDLSGTTSPALDVTNSTDGSSGTWSFAGQQPINFSHIESLQSTADLDVSNSAPGTVVEGQLLTYTITIHNNSALPIDNVVLTDVLPAGVTFDSGLFDQGTVTNSNGTVTVDIGTIAAGATVNGTITVKAVDEGSLSNTISLTSDSPNAIPAVTANTTVTDPAVVAAGGFTVDAIKGFLSSEQTVAAFADPGGAEDLANYSADIDWGDGSGTSTGTITFDSGTGVFTVTGQHDFAAAGTYAITVTIHHSAAPDATATSTAQVANPTVQAQGGLTINAVEGIDTGSVDVATFTDPGGAGPLADYSADIDWGDGTTTAGTITYDAGSDTFTIHGSHTYAEDGQRLVQVTIHRVAAPDATVNSNAIVAEPAIAPTGVAVNGNEFSELNNVVVATFTHGNNTEPAGDFAVTIDWGDGTSSAGTVALSGGVYTVTGSHTYTDEGVYAISVSIVDDSASANVQTTATMLEELLPDGTRGTADQRFISELYRELLGRPVDADGLAHWSAMLANGASRADIARGILASQEYLEFQVKGLYQQYLHRDVEADALAYWTQFLANGHSVEELAANLVGSDEYFNVRGGGTDQGFIDALFHDALGRAADPQGETAFEALLAGGKSHLEAADVVFGSPEYRHGLVQDFYYDLLARNAEQDGLDYWAGQLADRSDEEVIASIVSQDEFYARTAS